MFIGHFAVGFAAKRVAPRTSLGTLFVAAQLADLLWPIFVLAHAEQVEVRPGATAVTPLEFVSYPYALIAFLLVVYLASLFGPPPPSGRIVAMTALSMWLLVAWAAWADRHRAATGALVDRA